MGDRIRCGAPVTDSRIGNLMLARRCCSEAKAALLVDVFLRHEP